MVEPYLSSLRAVLLGVPGPVLLSTSQSSEPAVALIFPVAGLASLQNIRDADDGQILGLLVSELGRHLQAQRRSVHTIERRAVHFVTHQRLRMQRGSHVDRFVVIVGALDLPKMRARVCSHQLEKLRAPRAPKRADNLPAFHADMPCVLTALRERLDLPQRVLAP